VSPGSSAAPLIELRNVCKRYGGDDGPTVHALRGISLSIHAGEFVAIIGTSGSGKSTLMHLLGCLDRPTEGTYLFEGRDVATLSSDDLAALRREVFGFVFQSHNLIATESARENVEVPAFYAGAPEAERERRAFDLLQRFGLSDRVTHLPYQLSGGQQQRVSLARALMNGGRVILADEPTGSLDSENGREVMALLNELARAGHTVILVTHDREVAANAHRTIEIHDGSVVADIRRGEQPSEAASNAPHDPGTSPTQAVSLRTDIEEACRAAWRIMWLHRIRTSLTLLGIVIGVASVVVMLAIGAGAQRKVMQEIAELGVNNMHIVSTPGSSFVRGGVLTVEDAEALRGVPNVRTAMPYVSSLVTARRGNIDHHTEAGGATVDFREAMNWKLAKGTFFDADDEKNLAQVAVIGDQAKRALFPEGSDPVGQTILLDNVPFEIIGVLEPKGALLDDVESDNRIVVPYRSAVARLTGDAEPDWILVSVNDLKRAAATEDAIVKILSTQRRAEDFRIYNSAEAVQMHNETESTMRLMLGLIAAISLVVGGIGVMNVMLMAVRERTREIGIRMAVGARQRDIMRQFMTEAVLVTTVGGAVGVVAGLLIGGLLILWDVPIIFSLSAMILAFGCAVLTGLVFGYTPASKAARLDPVIALASE
jgi:macrolide transport system ATP-binding/permease protein